MAFTLPLSIRRTFSSIATRIAAHKDGLTLLLALGVTPVLVLIFLMKFAADLATATLPRQGPSMLSSYSNYWAGLQGMMAPRIGGNYLVYGLAKLLERVVHIPADNRIHPLRLSAAIVSTCSMWIGALPVLRERKGRWDWRVFYVLWLLLTLMSLYVYMPYDLPSTALISLAMWRLLERRPLEALVLMLITGLFRESSLHVAWFAVSLLFIPQLSPGLAWAGTFLAAFFAEWALIHHLIPTPPQVRVAGLWADLGSPSVWASIALVGWFTAQAAVTMASRIRGGAPDSFDKFFLIQLAMVIPWLLFYKVNNGNWSEFRMLIPILVPLVYAIAYRPPEVAGTLRV